MKVKYCSRAALLALSFTFLVTTSLCAESVIEYSPNKLTSAVSSAMALAQINGKVISPQMSEKIRLYPANASLRDVQSMMVDLTLPVEENKASLDQILERDQPVILQLKNPDEYVLLLDSVQDENGISGLRLLQNLDSMVNVVLRSELEPRFTGVALITPKKTEANAALIQLESRDFHFKIRHVGVPVEHSYKFVNAGKSNLHVQLTKTYCGCGGSVKFEIVGGTASVFKPGESGEVRMTYAVPTAAAVNETTTLLTNDPAQPQVFLTVRGEPARKLEVSTQKLSFEAPKGKSVEQSFEVSGLPSLVLGQPILDNDKFSATAVRILANDEQATWRVTVKLGEKTSSGQHQATLTIPTNDPSNGTVTAPISAKVL